LLVVIPHTTAVRGNRWELPLPKPFLNNIGVFHLQQIQLISLGYFESRLGTLTPIKSIRRGGGSCRMSCV
jgi:mRNA-degrading endonuclease toxin of MazEF toxin-antitoxin module